MRGGAGGRGFSIGGMRGMTRGSLRGRGRGGVLRGAMALRGEHLVPQQSLLGLILWYYVRPENVGFINCWKTTTRTFSLKCSTLGLEYTFHSFYVGLVLFLHRGKAHLVILRGDFICKLAWPNALCWVEWNTPAVCPGGAVNQSMASPPRLLSFPQPEGMWLSIM